MRCCRFAHVQDMDAGTTCLSLKLGMGLRLQSTDAMTLAVSRLVEERVGMAEGPADIRKWLLIIGERALLAFRSSCSILPFLSLWLSPSKKPNVYLNLLSRKLVIIGDLRTLLFSHEVMPHFTDIALL